jgi:hypothetical protein
MFLQIGKRYTPFSALLQIPSNITNNLCSSGSKRFFAKSSESGPFKLKKNVQRPNLEQYLQIGTNFNPP